MGSMPPAHHEGLLNEWSSGDEEALNVLMPLVRREVQQLARRHMRHERHGHTLQATALVSEAYLRLLELKQNPIGKIGSTSSPWRLA